MSDIKADLNKAITDTKSAAVSERKKLIDELKGDWAKYRVTGNLIALGAGVIVGMAIVLLIGH